MCLFPCFCFLFVLACCLVNNGGVVVWRGLVCLFGFVVLVACRLLIEVRGVAVAVGFALVRVFCGSCDVRVWLFGCWRLLGCCLAGGARGR